MQVEEQHTVKVSAQLLRSHLVLVSYLFVIGHILTAKSIEELVEVLQLILEVLPALALLNFKAWTKSVVVSVVLFAVVLLTLFVFSFVCCKDAAKPVPLVPDIARVFCQCVHDDNVHQREGRPRPLWI